MIHDYKNVISRRPARPAGRNYRWHWHGAIFFLVAAILVLFLVESRKSQASDEPTVGQAPEKSETSKQPPSATASKRDNNKPALEMASYAIKLPPATTGISTSKVISNPEPSDEPEWQTFVVEPGYNLAIICSRAGVKPSEVHALMQLGESVTTLKKLYPNDKILLKIHPDGTLMALQYDIHQSERLLVTRTQKQESGQPVFEAELIKRPLEARPEHASGVINDSLYIAALKAGLSHQITGDLANLFGWDIDFTQQVRKGDRFTVVYENYYRDGEKIDDSNGLRDVSSTPRIIAAEFINDGTVYRALRYTDPNGKTDYYTPDGNNIRKTFMRNPVDARVSSHFNPKRLHPLLHKTRPHRGVDYAAPKGTPIKSAGDGKVVFRGTQGGYGRTIIIQHGQRYSTLYAHMSAYANNTAKGRKIKQGQTIGYVGKSGLATGVHLHYEFRIDGVHHNPLTVKHPSVAPVPDQFRADFLQKTRSQVAQLDTLNRVNMAADTLYVSASSI
jgi:murein DD-endopeptidase MepM/ murein hydrolase activator NlpD